MRLKSMRVVNYKGFADSGTIAIGKHWTVIVGRNNSGKTSLLECLAYPQFSNKPHRHIDLDPTIQGDQTSQLEVSIEVETVELKRAVLNQSGPMYTPVHPGGPTPEWLQQQFLGVPAHTFSVTRAPGGQWQAGYPSHRLFERDPTQSPQVALAVVPSEGGRNWRIQEGLHRGDADNVGHFAGSALLSNTYVFQPERRVRAVSGVEHELSLRPDASNLPSALHYLYNTNWHLFQDLLSLVQRVLPEVKMVDAPPESGGAHIRIWNSGFNERRSDLAVGLEECGTGVGQVLAILFVIVTATTDKIIVIDEPNSYLHPGASRALMHILQAQRRHQFIVSTHSPEVISALEPDRLVVVRWADGKSHAESHAGVELTGIRSAFQEVGVRLADVFGYDRVVWVEGPTEEKCFPMLLESEGGALLEGIAFVAVADTGSLEGRNAEAVWRVYNKLSQRSAFVPGTVSIGLDREGKDEPMRAKLIERSAGLIRFLPRRAYENYLLHPSAIAAVMQEEDPTRPVSAEHVAAWLVEHRLDAKYYSGPGVRVPAAEAEKENWQQVVDAPKLLQDLIGHFSDQTQDFKGNKVRYSYALTVWLLKHDRDHLHEVVQYAKSLLVPVAGTNDQ